MQHKTDKEGMSLWYNRAEVMLREVFDTVKKKHWSELTLDIKLFKS